MQRLHHPFDSSGRRKSRKSHFLLLVTFRLGIQLDKLKSVFDAPPLN
jgi:hypothetical protein